jgi:lipocalin
MVLLAIVALLSFLVYTSAQSTENKGTFPRSPVGEEPFLLSSLKGNWFEIFTTSTIKRFENDCTKHQIIFSGDNCAYLNVTTTCNNIRGVVKQYEPEKNNGKLHIIMDPYQPDWSPFSNYIVIKRYGPLEKPLHILLGSDQSNMFWLLSHQFRVPQDIIDDAKQRLESAGYDTDLIAFN